MIEPLKKPKDQKRKGSLRYEIILDGAVRKYPSGREVCENTPKGRAEYRKRVIAMAMRQNWVCVICDLPMVISTTDFRHPTFDHERSRGFGGGSRDDRIIDESGKPLNFATHSWCNSAHGSQRIPR